MPMYGFRCACGHAFDARVPYSTGERECVACGGRAQREFVPAAFGRSGFAIPPMRERPLPVGRFLEAQHDMVRDAERHGVEAPDVVAAAKHQAATIRAHAPELVTGT